MKIACIKQRDGGVEPGNKANIAITHLVNISYSAIEGIVSIQLALS